MKNKLIKLTYQIELETGEKLTLPNSLVDSIGAGRWLITVQPYTEDKTPAITRSHDAFLKGYALEDEGLYDDYTTG